MINFEFHSPVEKVFYPPLDAQGIEVYLKRDDLIHPFISGNKWRKLKFLLKKADKEGKTHIVTFGGAWSNHLLATACACAKFGFKSTGIIRGEEVENEVLFLCRMFGMSLKFVSREDYRYKQEIFNKFFNSLPGVFFVDEGGASKEATLGCAEIIDELDQFYNHIFCACGTGTTAAGIINGLIRHKLDSVFNGIPVLKGGDFIKEDIDKYLDGMVSYQLHTEYHFGGYAKTAPPLINFIRDFSSATGILLDPVYTGKMMYSILDLVKKDYFVRGTKILAVHTGGIFGILGMKNKFVK